MRLCAAGACLPRPLRWHQLLWCCDTPLVARFIGTEIFWWVWSLIARMSAAKDKEAQTNIGEHGCTQCVGAWEEPAGCCRWLSVLCPTKVLGLFTCLAALV